MLKYEKVYKYFRHDCSNASNWSKANTDASKGSILRSLFFLNDLPSQVLFSESLLPDGSSLRSILHNLHRSLVKF